jgi:hypothetical protein
MILWVFSGYFLAICTLFEPSLFGVLLGECIDIRCSQGEYNWLEAWIVKTFSGFLAASFGSEASSRFKKIYSYFYGCKSQVLAYAFLNSLVDFSLLAFNGFGLVLSSHMLCFFQVFMTMSRDSDPAINLMFELLIIWIANMSLYKVYLSKLVNR